MGINNTYSFNLLVYDVPRLSSQLMREYEVSVGGNLEILLSIVNEFLPIDVFNDQLPSFIGY
jgi:hypothetical protein